MAVSKSRFAPRDTALAGVLAVSGYLVAVYNLAGASWDGGWYLFSSLQNRVPFTPHHRYATYPLSWLVIRASEIVHDPATLGRIFGTLLALFPLGSLALSWFFLRREEDVPLRVWPTLGILLAALPGQLCLISEATLAGQLLWPMLALIAAGPRDIGEGVCLLLLAILAALLHPTAVLILALIAALLVWRAWRDPDAKTSTAFFWAGTLTLLAAGKLLETMHYATGYERDQASFQAVYWQFGNSVLGYPLLFLGGLYVLGCTLLPSSQEGSSLASPGGRRLLCFGMAAVGVWWAGRAAHWSGLLDYRRFVLPAMGPLVAMAGWHFHRLKFLRVSAPAPAAFILSSAAAVFAVVLVVQSLVWGSLLGRFSVEISRLGAQKPFISADDLAFTYGTPLRHWSATPLSILLQGRRPQTIYVLHPESIRADGLEIYPPDSVEFKDGWFALAGLGAKAEGKR